MVSGGRGFDGTPIKSGAAGAPAFARDARFGWAGLLATRAPARRPSVPIHETPPRIDDDGIACEDLVLADLNGDGKLDIIASGRATHNLRVYFNETK